MSWELRVEVSEVSPRSLTNPQRLPEEAVIKENSRGEVGEAPAWLNLKLKDLSAVKQ